MRKTRIAVLIFFISIAFWSNLFAGIISEGWKDARSYRPELVLFMHGFGRGEPNDWAAVDANLQKIKDRFLVTLDFLILYIGTVPVL